MHAGRGFLSLSLNPSLWMFIRLAPGVNPAEHFTDLGKRKLNLLMVVWY